MIAGVYSGEEHGRVTLARQERPGDGWQGWFDPKQPGAHGAWACVLGRNGDGQLELFAVDTEGLVWHTGQDTADPWQWLHAEWSSLNPSPAVLRNPLGPRPRPTAEAGPVVARNMHGQLELFLVDSGSAVWHWQRREDGWSWWKSLGTPAGPTPRAGPLSLSAPVVARNKHGRLELFVLGGQGVLHAWQVSEGDWLAWELMGDPLLSASQLAVGAHADGRLVLFTTTVQAAHPIGAAPPFSNTLYHREQTPGGSWSDWEEWTAPGILEALIPGRMQSHACTAEVP